MREGGGAATTLQSGLQPACNKAACGSQQAASNHLACARPAAGTRPNSRVARSVQAIGTAKWRCLFCS
eukprot:6699808-Alexandrium_andersonii.AAC.1